LNEREWLNMRAAAQVHHSLEVPGLHGRGGIYFVRHCSTLTHLPPAT